MGFLPKVRTTVIKLRTDVGFCLWQNEIYFGMMLALTAKTLAAFISLLAYSHVCWHEGSYHCSPHLARLLSEGALSERLRPPV